MSELINAVKEGNLGLVKKLLKVDYNIDENPSSPFNYDEDGVAMFYKFMGNYCQWVDEFAKNNYVNEILQIATDFYPEGTFTKEGFYEHHIEKANILLKKSVKYLDMARAIIEKGNVHEN